VLDDDVALWSTTRQVAAIRARDSSASDLLALHVTRVERSNPSIKAIVTLDLDRATRDAAIVERVHRPRDTWNASWAASSRRRSRGGGGRAALGLRGHHAIVWPPLTRKMLPVAKRDASDTR
jgi:Asp-tRNA(Asn)/Glu-tRNA(Gln) amidotransferase A subunit family amidase